jgi:hypothetical protein
MYTTVCRDGIEFEVKITDEEILIYSDEELTNVLDNSLLESIRQEALEFERRYKEEGE